MDKCDKIEKNNELHVIEEEPNQSQTRTVFKLPSINGDQQIYLGQSIIALVGLNQSGEYSEELNKTFLKEMFADILRHFNISIEELYRTDLINNVLEHGYEYELETNISHKVKKKTEI